MRYRFWLIVATLTASLVGNPPSASAAGASLYFAPAQGSYFVGSTFEVSVSLNTGGQAVNTVDTQISFPADKLQVVNPSVGTSFIQVWIAQPQYSNSDGTLSFQGGIPSPGITTSAGIVSTIQFRVKTAGKAVIRFSDKSQVLANDGQGTNLLSSRSEATYNLTLAPPAGPLVSSPSHPDQNRWYNNRTIDLTWESPNSTNYSYIFDNAPTTNPDDVSETTETTLSKAVDADGLWYFHIRAKNGSSWGGATAYLARIDTLPPASFTPELDPSLPQKGQRTLASFTTTDAASGIDHYEVRVINNSQNDTAVSLFTETTSPYQLPALEDGQYTLVVRAYDVAGNYTDGTLKFGVGLSGALNSTLNLFWLKLGLAGIIIILLIFLILGLWRRRRDREEERQRRLASQQPVSLI